jgi:hypothetical protein
MHRVRRVESWIECDDVTLPVRRMMSLEDIRRDHEHGDDGRHRKRTRVQYKDGMILETSADRRALLEAMRSDDAVTFDVVVGPEENPPGTPPMISITSKESKRRTFKIPPMGRNRRGVEVPLEGPVEIVVDNAPEGFGRVEIDPRDPTGFTVMVTPTITEQTPGTGPWLVTGTVAPDGRVGAERKPVVVPFAWEITPDLDAVSFVAEIGEEEDIPPPPSPAKR